VIMAMGQDVHAPDEARRAIVVRVLAAPGRRVNVGRSRNSGHRFVNDADHPVRPLQGHGAEERIEFVSLSKFRRYWPRIRSTRTGDIATTTPRFRLESSITPLSSDRVVRRDVETGRLRAFVRGRAVRGQGDDTYGIASRRHGQLAPCSLEDMRSPDHVWFFGDKPVRHRSILDMAQVRSDAASQRPASECRACDKERAQRSKRTWSIIAWHPGRDHRKRDQRVPTSPRFRRQRWKRAPVSIGMRVGGARVKSKRENRGDWGEY